MDLKPKHRFSCEMDYELYNQLRDKSKKLRIPMTALIKEAVEDMLLKYGVELSLQYE